MDDLATGRRRYLAVNATVVTALRALGVASGFVLDALIVGLFGLGHQTDAYFAAFAIPYLIASTIETQAVKVMVPYFAQRFERDGREATWSHLRDVMATGGSVCALIASVLTAGAWLLMPVQVPGLDAQALQRAIQLQMMLAWLVLVQGVSTIVSGALYADHHYVSPNTSRLVTNSVAIAAVVLWHGRLGIYALALGMVAGGCVQLACLLLAARSRGFRRGRARMDDPDAARILGLCIYPVLGQAFGESRVFLENFLASLLGAGSLSAVRYANRIVSALAGIMLGGLTTTALPMLSGYAVEGRFKELKDGLMTALRWAALLAVPIGLWLVFAGEPLIVVAFQRGRFSSSDSAQIGLLLALLAPYVLASRVADFGELVFYSDLDTRTPLWANAVFLAVYTTLCLSLLPRLGIVSFAVATSAATAFAAWFMMWLVQRRFGPLEWRESKGFVQRLAIAGAVSGAGFWIASESVYPGVAGGPLGGAIRLLAVTGSGLGTFLGAAVVLRLFNWRYLLHVAREALRAASFLQRRRGDAGSA